MDDNFDYMDLLETQYAQYYATASVPAFDPAALGAPETATATLSMVKSAVPVPVLDPSIAAALPGIQVASARLLVM